MAEPLNKSISRDIADAKGQLKAMWPLFKKRFRERTGNELILTCTYRSFKEQQILYAQGRTTKGRIVTWVDGVKNKSNHNYYPSRAIDVAVLVGGKISWSDEDYRPLGLLCRDMGLVWGGNFSDGKKDMPHIELPKDA